MLWRTLTALHWKKGHSLQRCSDGKVMWKKTDGGLWVTITDVISSALIEHIRLNRGSLSGLLLKWSINPSTSLKCIVTGDGNSLSGGLFACLLSPRLPSLPCGKGNPYQKGSGVSSLVIVDTIMLYKKTNNVWRQIMEESLGGCSGMIWMWFPYESMEVKNKACGLWLFHSKKPLLQPKWGKQYYLILNGVWFWGLRSLGGIMFASASAAGDKLNKWYPDTQKRYSWLKQFHILLLNDAELFTLC